MQTERVTFLTSPSGKAELATRAAARGLSVGEYVRRKVEEDDEPTSEQETELEMLVHQVNESIPKMEASLDRMIETLRETHEYVESQMQEMRNRG